MADQPAGIESTARQRVRDNIRARERGIKPVDCGKASCLLLIPSEHVPSYPALSLVDV